jgi:uncharacterized protein YcbX
VDGRIQSIWRHPVKGFTPEPLDAVELTAGGYFPNDRMYAVEDGPSGFDPAAPGHISKQKFTVLAKIAQVAKVRTRLDDATGLFEAAFEGKPILRANLDDPVGRDELAAWLADVLGDKITGPLKVLPGPGRHRFMDHPQGHVSVINLASVRDLETRIGRRIDPRRFRANIYVEGWPAWVENGGSGKVTLGDVEAEIFKPIVRCVATHVDPDTAEKDIELVPALFDTYGHQFCGIYVNVLRGGRVTAGDPISLHLESAVTANPLAQDA